MKIEFPVVERRFIWRIRNDFPTLDSLVAEIGTGIGCMAIDALPYLMRNHRHSWRSNVFDIYRGMVIEKVWKGM
jgi:hypothetical protein